MDALEFLRELFCVCPPDGAVELRLLPNDKQSEIEAERYFCKSPPEVKRHLARWTYNQGDYGLFFGVSQRRGDATRGQKTDVQAVPAIWLDLDTEKLGWNTDRTLAALKVSPLRPSWVVRSGRGLHLYWLLDEPVVLGEPHTDEWFDLVARIENLNRRMATIFGGDNVQDITRVMRIPGTYNTKGGKKRPVSVVLDDGDFWDFEALIKAADAHDEFLTDGEWVDAESVKAIARQSKADSKLDAHLRRFGEDAGFGDRRFTWEGLWAHARLGGGSARDNFIGLNEAALRGIAILYARFGGEWTDEHMIDEVMAQIEAIKERDAPHETWDWKAERRQVADQLERFKPRMEALKQVEKKKRGTGKRKDGASGANGPGGSVDLNSQGGSTTKGVRRKGGPSFESCR